MSWVDFFGKAARRARRQAQRQAARRRFFRSAFSFSPTFELLETRNLLAVTVDVTTDTDASNPASSPNDSTGHISLRSAMEYANDHAGTAINFGTLFNTAQTITLGSSLPDISASMTITGPSSTNSGLVTISGGGTVRDFYMLEGTVSISNVTIANGFASASDPHGPQGAGFFEDFDGVDLNAVTFTNCTFSGNATANVAGGEGGAIWAAGGLTVTNCTFSTNTAAASAGLGGAIFWGGSETSTTPLAISGSTFVSNSADEGGAIYFGGTNSATLTNSTFTQNSASAFGGAFEATSSFTMVNCTLTNNSAGARSGGIDLFTSGVVLTNTIVSGNTSGSTADISGESNGGDLVLANAHNNLLGQIGSGSTVTNGSNGNIVGVTNPLLLTLGNYGGLTQTMPPGPGSAAINAGTSSGAPSTDQQGNSRPLPVGTNVDIGAVEISQIPDLTVTATHSGNFSQGAAADTFTLTATNSGTGSTTGTVTVTDALPSGLTATASTGTGWTIVQGTGTSLTFSRSSTLASAASYPAITVTVSVASTAAASVTNTATVAGGGETNTTNDTGTDAITVSQIPDLTVVAGHSGSFTEGDSADTYTITVSNSGGASTSGTVTVTDTLPTGMTATAAAGSGWTVTQGTGSTVTATRASALAGGSSYPALTVTVSLASNAAASLTNTATVAGGGEVITTNDTATDPTTVILKPDLIVTETHSGNFTEGDQNDHYTITVTNIGGASTSGGVTVTDTTPTGLSPSGGSGASWSNPVVSSNTETFSRSDVLTAGASYPAFTMSAVVASNAPASLTNTATVAGGGEVNTANDSATDPTTIIQEPDMAISLSHAPLSFAEGDAADQYTIAVSNIGGIASSGAVTVTDTLPAELTPLGFTAPNWTGSIVGQTFTATRSDTLSASSSYDTIFITVSVANNATLTTNTASVSGGGEVNTANDTSKDSTNILHEPDLSITGTHTGNFTQGDTADQYTLTVTNVGFTVTSSTVTVTDTLPAGLTPIGVTAPNWTTSIVGQTLTATRSDALNQSSSYDQLTLTVSVAGNAAASLTNTATVAGGNEINSANDTSLDPTTISGGPDLTLTASHSGNFSQGDTADKYTITVSNSGTQPTSGTTTLTDAVPAGLTATAAAGAGWITSISGNTLTATSTSIVAANASFPGLTLTVSVANSAAASLTNTATVAGGGETNTTNDTAIDPTTVVQKADLTVAASHTGNFTQGDAADQYTITVTNSGFASTSGTVTVTDALPAGLTATAASGTGWTTSIAGNTLTATSTNVVAANASFPALTLTVSVANSAAASLTNTAAVSGGGEVNTANDTGTNPTTVVQEADLTVAASHSGNFTQGDVADQYTITVSNSGFASTSGTVTVTDALPAGLTGTTASGSGWTTSIVSNTLTATSTNVVAANASFPALTLTASVANSAAASLTNTAAVSGGGEVNTANDTGTNPTTIIQKADLTIAASHSGNFSQGDAADQYTITVTNSGFASTSGTVTVTDVLPSGLTGTTASGSGWTTSIAGNTLTATSTSAVAANASFPALTLTASVANSAAASLTNTATVSGGGEVNTANDTAIDPTTVVQKADLTVAASHTGNFNQGDTADQYTITVSNSGFAATSGTVTVTDALPAGLTATAASGSGWTTSISGNTLTATSTNIVAASATFPALTVTVSVANSAAASLTNTATVSGGGEVNTANDTGTNPTTVVQEADLTVAASHIGNFSQGDAADQYTITVSNSGFASTSGTVTVTDALPAGLTATAASGSGWTTSISGNTLTATSTNIVAASATFPALTVTVSVANSAAASLTNTATVSGGGEVNTANDTGTNPTTVVQEADLTIAASHTGNFTQGDAADQYTITVTNSGFASTSGTVTVTDALPAGLTATAASGTGWTTSISGNTLTATSTNIVAASAAFPALTVTVSVANSAAASLTNTATVSGGGEVNTANDTGTNPTTVVQEADLTVAASHTGNFTQGDAADQYTITVTNSGFASTSGTVTVTDALPAGLTATAASGTGWTTSISGNTLTATSTNIVAASAAFPALTVTVSVANSAAASLTNTATVSGGGEVNTANDTGTNPTTVVQEADLTVAASHTGNFSQGDAADQYTITVSNSGFAATSGTVTVTDALPAGLTATAASGTGWSTSIAGNTLTATGTNIVAANGTFPALTVTVSVANSAAASLTNTATVAGGGEVNTANDTGTNPTTVVQKADLTIAASHTGNFSQGDAADQYTITVSNSGFASTSGTVTVTDALPAGLTATVASGSGWTTSIAGNTLTATSTNVVAASATFPALTVTVSVANSAAASLTNTASVAGGGEVNTANDTGTNPTTVVQKADLTIAASHSSAFHQGDTADQYTITVSNSGFASTSGTVTVTDVLPTGLTATAATGTGWTTSVAGNTLTATSTSIVAASASFPALTVTVSVANNASTVTNTATVAGGGEVNTTNDTATDPTAIGQQADLTVAASHVGNFSQGDAADQYTITVSNSGFASTIGTVTVTDALPAGLTATAASGSGWTTSIAGNTLTATSTNIVAASATFPALTVTVSVANSAAASLTNTVSVSGGGEVNTANDTGTNPTTVVQKADLTIAASHTGNFSQGDAADQYTITVSNGGFASTSGTVTVTDALPAGLTATAASGSGWTTSISGNTLTATSTNVVAASATFPALTVTVSVANSAAASLTNTASVAGGGEVNTANDTGTNPTTVVQEADLTVAASHTGNFSQGDAADQYTITVSNSGFASTSGTVTVIDALPAGLTGTAASGTGWNTSIVGNTLTATSTNVVAANSSFPGLTVTVSVANSAAASPTNTATVSGGGEVNTANDTGTNPTIIVQKADLTVVASHAGSFTQGDTADKYTITVSNSGFASTSGTVTVTDALPAGVTATAASGTGWNTSITGNTLTATSTSAVAASASFPALTLTVSVANSAAASLTNTATVSGGGEVNTANDTANDPTTIVQKADLTIATSHTGNFAQGDAADKYTITATNSGNGSTSGVVTVTDTVPAGLTPTAAAGPGWSTTIVGSTVTATRSDVLTSTSSYPALTVTVSVANSAAASVTNAPRVAGGGEVITTNDTATDQTNINQLPDLTISLAHSGNFQTNDTADTYTVTVTNSGFASTSGTVTVTDALPAGLTPTGATGSGWTTAIVGSTVTATRSDALASNASYSPLTITESVASNATSVTNTATVAGGGEVNIANDTASDMTTIGSNHAPVLNSAAPFKLADVNTNPNSGTLLTTIIANGGANAITDSDPGAVKGIAITAADNSLGQWQYSLDNGSTWTDVPAVSNTSALLLAADANTRLRVNAPLTAFGTSSITFRAWDQTSGAAGSTADTSANGGSTAFSSASGTATQFVSPYVVSGSTLTVNGTPSADQFSISGGVSSLTAVMDGISQTFSTTAITAVIFNGNGAADVTTIVAEQSTATATFGLNQTTVTGSGFNYQINNSPTVYVFGTSGDTATMNDTASDDLFYGLPGYSVMQNAVTNPTTYWHEAIGFSTVNAIATTGSDNAYLYDSSGNDTYTADNTGSQMAGSGYKVHAAGFDLAYGFFFNGGTDTANVAPNTTTTNYVYGTAADTANLTDSSGNDTFIAVPTSNYSVLQGSGFYNEVIDFGQVNAISSAGGSDTADFYDTTGNDTYNSTGNVSSLTSGAIFNQATGFATNYAFLSAGTDTANLHAGTNRLDYVYGTASDTVNFFSTSNSDEFIGEYPYSLMYFNNSSYYKQAIGFGTVNATASGTNETAYLYDSPGNDAIVAGGTTATLTMPSVVIGVNKFAILYAYSTNGGSDTKHVNNPVDFVFDAIGSWTSV